MLQMLECCSIQAWWLWIVQTYNNGSVFLKHKLLNPIVCWVDVQILLFENEDQNYLISIFFNGFTICWYVVLHKKSKFVPVLLCYYRYFGRNPSHKLILHVIVNDNLIWTALFHRNKNHWNCFQHSFLLSFSFCLITAEWWSVRQPQFPVELLYSSAATCICWLISITFYFSLRAQ